VDLLVDASAVAVAAVARSPLPSSDRSLCCRRSLLLQPDLEFSRVESWSRDVSRPVFTSLGLGLGLGTSESWSGS